jgi:hypothetical protein
MTRIDNESPVVEDEKFNIRTSNHTIPDAAEADYDGDSERVVPYTSTNLPERIAKKKYVKKSTTVDIISDHEDSRTSSEGTSVSINGIVGSEDVSSPSLDGTFSRASFSAVIKVSSLQASFAERTATEMQEIVGWYNQYEEADRFTKVSQSKSLPNNAMVCDDFDVDNKNDGLSLGCCIQDKSVRKEGTYSEDMLQNCLYGSTRMLARRDDSSQTMQVLEQSEAVNHIIRNTQYMADIIVELEHSSSSSDVDNKSSLSVTTSASCCPGLTINGDAGTKDEHTNEFLPVTNFLQAEGASSRIKKKKPPRASQKSKTAYSILVWFIAPILLSIIASWIWKLHSNGKNTYAVITHPESSNVLGIHSR